MRSASSDRIEALDVLRALALFGIIVTHAEMGFLAGRPPNPQFDVFSSLDAGVAEFVRVFANGKFFSIFSFLFGVSFAIQLQRSTSKAGNFAARFAWRLTLLFVIGFVHNLFFSGDILTVYALLGLLLIPLHRLDTRVLMVCASLLLFNVPGIVSGLMSSNTPVLTAEQQQAAAAVRAAGMESARRQLDIKQHGSVVQVVQMNLNESFTGKLSFQIATGRLYVTFGCFLLGICAWRAQLFSDSQRNRKIMRQLIVWAGIPAAITSMLMWLYPSGMLLENASQLGRYMIGSVQQVTLATFFVASVLLMYWKSPPHGWLWNLAPMGKMGLTTYLTQTVFGLLVFYGFGLGLLGRIGVAICVAIGIAFFVCQIFIARWWMRRYNQGPVEWLWRSATDRRFQTLLRPQGEPA
jgi:uncharacterized protein